MATWTTVPDTSLDPEKPGRSVDIKSIRDNITALAEGASGAPKIQPAAVPQLGWETIDSGTESAVASLDITDLSSTYRAYMLVYDNLRPANDLVDLWLRTSANNGVTFDAGSANYKDNIAAREHTAIDDLWTTKGSADTKIKVSLTHGNAANEIGSGRIVIYNPLAATVTLVDGSTNHHSQVSGLIISMFNGVRVSAAAVDAFQLLFSSGNIASVNWTLYGLRAS